MGVSIQKLLMSPFLLLSVLAAAIFMGVKYPASVESFDEIGIYYISLLKMIVLPYLFVTITASIARVVSDPNASRYTWRLVLIYPTTMVFAALVALGACLVVAPAGNVDQAAMLELGNIVSNDEAVGFDVASEVTFGKSESEAHAEAEHSFLDRFVPDNIFAALSEGDSLKVVIFCIIFGAALARHSDEGSRSLLEMFTVVQAACTQVIKWLNLMLPFALFAMVSTQVAKVGVGPLISLGPFVIVQVATGLVLIVISALIISRRAHVSPFAAIHRLQDTIILAITTRSSFACIPVAVRELTEKLHFDRLGTDLVMPLGTTICRIGTVPYMVIGAVFIAQVYGVQLDWQSYLIIIVGAVAAGFASSGASGAVGVVLISIVAEPMNLPVEAAIALFIAVDPIIDVVRTLVLVYGNCALTAIITPSVTSKGETQTENQNAKLVGMGQ